MAVAPGQTMSIADALLDVDNSQSLQATFGLGPLPIDGAASSSDENIGAKNVASSKRFL